MQYVSIFAERPRSPLALTPTLSVVIGLAAAIVIGALAIIVALRVPCGRRRKRLKRKELSQATTTDDDSPGPSDKSIASREVDGNESDEKNPDIIPDTIDSDDQVSECACCVLKRKNKKYLCVFDDCVNCL